MRKALLTLTALAGLVGAGAIGTASAATIRLDGVPAASLVQPVQYYGYHRGYDREEWRHRRWVEYHRYHRWHRWHGYDRRW